MINLNTASFSELKAYATENAIAIEGDRRRKQTYIDSIEDFWDTTGAIEAIAYSADIAKTTFEQDEPFTVEQPTPEKLSSVVCMQPLAFVLAAMILGVIWLAVGFGLATTRFVRWIAPHAQNTRAILQEKLSDRNFNFSFLEAIAIPAKP